MASKVLCDGSTVEWEPVWVDEECDECGCVTSQRDSAEPEFHGPSRKEGRRYFCSRCGEEYVGMAAAFEIMVDRLRPRIVEMVNSASPFYDYLRK